MSFKTAIVFAGGDVPDLSKNSGLLQHEADLIICADSGYRHARKFGIKPDIMVGDFDSYTGELPDDAEILRSPPEKDDTDTLLAVKTAIERGCEAINLYGASGGRLDHTIANIQTMIYAREHGCEVIICGDNAAMLQGAGEDKYFRSEDYFSIFSLTEKLEIEYLRGVKYPLENYTMKNSFPIGVSNEITSEKAELSIKSGLALIVFSHK